MHAQFAQKPFITDMGTNDGIPFWNKNIFCYSGGTEATAMFPKVAETLTAQGLQIEKLSEANNPVYAIKYDTNEAAVICFSKNIMTSSIQKNRLAQL
ncbi:hypothetical protein [Niabella ginsengisoli]|uniref:Uncharacterized protein n=1 Tax=Niabella ginsengisoli TaxID=522298 RepID=A0ABS9SKG3_9BACT|nr:hypothetical protein [Niabella ginsengisoli]MCH5598869.1 hypothetical protein [Niabella ginsengisoli]